MSNNDILKKLRIALQLRNSDIMEILQLVDFRITESELGALFRNEDHPSFKPCGDQILRNFLNGLIIYKRGSKDGSIPPQESSTREDEVAMRRTRPSQPDRREYTEGRPERPEGRPDKPWRTERPDDRSERSTRSERPNGRPDRRPDGEHKRFGSRPKPNFRRDDRPNDGTGTFKRRFRKDTED